MSRIPALPATNDTGRALFKGPRKWDSREKGTFERRTQSQHEAQETCASLVQYCRHLDVNCVILIDLMYVHYLLCDAKSWLPR
jgi:hypothetical protein